MTGWCGVASAGHRLVTAGPHGHHVLERFLAVLAATAQSSATKPSSGSPAEPSALPQAPSV
jgi:hypothetical protein